MFVIHEETEWGELDRSLAILKPAILLLDLAFPQVGRNAGVSAIQRNNPSTKVILLTRTPKEKEGTVMLEAGAKGYCETDIDSVLLNKAVKGVLGGEIWVPRNVIPQLVEDFVSLTGRRKKHTGAKPKNLLERLTPRERQIVRIISTGASNKEIASQLSISEKTVKAHLTDIFRKFAVSDRVHLVLLVNERAPKRRSHQLALTASAEPLLN